MGRGYFTNLDNYVYLVGKSVLMCRNAVHANMVESIKVRLTPILAIEAYYLQM